MKKKAENKITSTLTLIAIVIGLYSSLGYFLLNTNKIESSGWIFNIKIIYFLIALLFGTTVVLYVITLTKNKIDKEKKKK